MIVTRIIVKPPEVHSKNKLVVLTTEWLPWLQTTGDRAIYFGVED